MKTKSPPAVSHNQRLRPWLLGGMTALLVARPLFPSESAATFGDGLTMVMLWIALAVFWLLGAVGGRKFELRFGWTDAAVLMLVGWHTVAALWAVRHGTPRPAVNMLWEWIGMGLCFFLARQLIVTPREVRAVVAVMIALAVAVSTYGLYQRAYELPGTRAKYVADPDRTLRDAGLWFPPHSPERKLFEDRLQNTEPMATFALTNSLAAFLSPWMVVLAGMAYCLTRHELMGATGCLPARAPAEPCTGRQAASGAHAVNMARSGHYGAVQNRKRLAAMLVLLIPMAVCLLWTKSRSGYVAACAGLLLVSWLCRERKIRIGWKLPAAAVGAVLLLILAAVAIEGPTVIGRASKSLGYRVQYWQSSLRMIADHPWMGCGPGNFQEVYTQYKLPEASEEIADPHNFLLEIWATAGTPAALALLGVLGCFAWAVSRGEGREERGEGSGVRGQHSSAANPQSLISNPCSDAWRHVLIGGAIGFLLSLPLGLLGAAPPGIAPVLLGLPLAAVAMILLLGWIREGSLPGWLPAVGVAVLLIDLLAAGGIGLPSVAGTFWLLMAIGLQGQRPQAYGAGIAWAALAGAIALTVACYSTAYRPVLGCLAELRLADRLPARAVEHLEAAAAADSLSAEPWQRLAAARFDAWRQAPSPAAFDRFEQSDAEMLRLSPNSASAWLISGDWYFETSANDKAVAAYGQAVRLYPTSALSRAKLAEAYAAAGDKPAFRREADAALRLDQATPHADKKLPAKLREKLRHDLGETP